MYLLTWHGPENRDVAILSECVQGSSLWTPLEENRARVATRWVRLRRCFSRSVEVSKHDMVCEKDWTGRVVQAEVMTMTARSYWYFQPTISTQWSQFCIIVFHTFYLLYSDYLDCFLFKTENTKQHNLLRSVDARKYLIYFHCWLKYNSI